MSGKCDCLIDEWQAMIKQELRDFGRSRLAQFGKAFPNGSQYVKKVRHGIACVPFACVRVTANAFISPVRFPLLL